MTTVARDRATIIDHGFETAKRWGIRILVLAAVAYIGSWVIKATWVALFPVSLALILSTVLAPIALWLRRHKVPAGLATALSLLTFIAIMAIVFSVLIPQVVNEAPSIADKAVDGLQAVRNWLISGPLDLSEGQLTAIIEAVQDRITASAATIGSGAISTLSAATSVVINLVLVLMLTFFFVKDGNRFVPWLHSILGERAGKHTSEVLHRSWTTLGSFIRTQGLVSLIDAVFIGVGLAILGQPLWFPLAIITFFGGFIPIVGAFVSGGLAVLVTVVTNSPRDALIALAIVLVVQQLEGNVLSPLLQGKYVNLPAAIVLLSVTIGGSQFGIAGAFLAVPVVASVAGAMRYMGEQIDKATDNGDTSDPETEQAVAEQHDD